MRGSELDITGTAFSTLLIEELSNQGFSVSAYLYFFSLLSVSSKRTNQVQDNAFEIIDIGGMLSGVSAAGYTYGLPGTFNFNGAKYNVSTREFGFSGHLKLFCDDMLCY